MSLAIRKQKTKKITKIYDNMVNNFSNGSKSLRLQHDDPKYKHVLEIFYRNSK